MKETVKKLSSAIMIQAASIMIQRVSIMIQAVTVCVIRKNITTKRINKWLSGHKLKSISQTTTSSAGTCAASGRRRPAQDHVLFAYWRVPSPPPGTTPRPIEDGFTSASWVVVVGGGWSVGQRRFGLGGGRSCCSLLPSRSLRVVRFARAFVSGHPRPCRARRGRPASSWQAAGRRIRVASEWRERRHGAPPAGGLVAPGSRRGRSARPARAGRSEHHKPKPRT